MYYNFEIVELKEDTRYTVRIVDRWDGRTKTEEMTGANLRSFTNDHAYHYDIYAEEITEESEEKKITRTAEEVTAEIIGYFKNNEDVFNDCAEELDNYNGYLNDDRYHYMEELDDFYADAEPLEILSRAFYGRDANYKGDEPNAQPFNPSREYFKFDGYGNLISTDYKDYSSYLDKYIIAELLNNRREIDTIDDNSELSELFDELENL